MTTRAITHRGTTLPHFNRDPFFGPFLERVFGTEPFRTDLALPWSEDLSNRTWKPAVDVKETDEAYVLNAELPGLEKKDIHITLEDNVLTLSGERRFEKETDKDNYHRIERAYGSFTRSFSLGGGVDAEKVQATFKDGVLTMTVPKTEETRPRQIEIH
jgi:HSP20 family protein